MPLDTDEKFGKQLGVKRKWSERLKIWKDAAIWSVPPTNRDGAYFYVIRQMDDPEKIHAPTIRENAVFLSTSRKEAEASARTWANELLTPMWVVRVNLVGRSIQTETFPDEQVDEWGGGAEKPNETTPGYGEF